LISQRTRTVQVRPMALPTGAEYRENMSRIRPENPCPENTDHSVTADVLLRQEPDEEEDEEEDEGDGKEDNDDDDNGDDGYSE
jgi:hypothetical protein